MLLGNTFIDHNRGSEKQSTGENALKRRRASSKRKETEDRLWAIFDKIRAEGRPTGPTDFAKEAGVDRSYFYTFHELAAEVSAYAMQTQPKRSRRGAAISKGQAKKRGIEDRVRREHTQWSKEVPELKHQIEEAKSIIRETEGKIETLKDQRQRLMRACELLLMIASEAGANPKELEEIRTKAIRDVTQPINPKHKIE